MLTCRFWRNISLDAPTMWTRIAFTDFGRRSHHHIASLFLERSRSSLLHVYVEIRNVRNNSFPYQHVSEERHVDIKTLLQPHLSRIRTLLFKGDPRHFFPLEAPSPELRCIQITKPDEWFSPPESISESSPRRTIFASSGGEMVKTIDNENDDLDPIRFIDPLHIENLSLSLYATWDSLQGDPFLECARRLKVLKLPNNALRYSRDIHFEFPLLEELRLGEPCTTLTRQFGPMPNLVHLTVTEYAPDCHYNILSNENTKWPTAPFPSLQTFTLDHHSLPDLASLFITCPRIRGIHLHGVRGFLNFLQLLAQKNEATSNSNMLPQLQYLRLWPMKVRGALRAATYDNFQACLQALSEVMSARPQLHVQIGTTIYECWGEVPGESPEVEWAGQWDKDAILTSRAFDSHKIFERLSITSSYADSPEYGIGGPPLPELGV
ncbi:hypothetical protein DL93DRAFT_2230735 [Clavulina sp. PMI_390]|nr:hypothetical protein DL93DRAFT_2230735 [Clavulina sp. PMI_390]